MAKHSRYKRLIIFINKWRKKHVSGNSWLSEFLSCSDVLNHNVEYGKVIKKLVDVRGVAVSEREQLTCHVTLRHVTWYIAFLLQDVIWRRAGPDVELVPGLEKLLQCPWYPIYWPADKPISFPHIKHKHTPLPLLSSPPTDTSSTSTLSRFEIHSFWALLYWRFIHFGLM